MRKPSTPPLNASLAQAVTSASPSGAKRAGYQPKPRLKQNRSRPGQTNMTFWMAISTHASLRALAELQGINLQQLVAGFVDKGLADAGEAPFKFKDE